MIVSFVYNILIFNYKDTKNYRDYQLFKRISYPELRLTTFLSVLHLVYDPNCKRILSDDTYHVLLFLHFPHSKTLRVSRILTADREKAACSCLLLADI